MLYFSKLKIVIIYSIIFFLSFFSFVNFIENENNFLLSKKVNLGLDLQGGSYLLLEVDSEPVIYRKLQQKLLNFRKYLKKNKIKYQNLKLKNQSINFLINNKDVEKFEEIFLNKDNLINVYYNQYRSYEMDYSVEDNKVKIEYSKFGLIEIKNSILNQSLEIVRKRIDEVGTKEPTIIKRGIERILIELPGLKDPNRIKKLLGKTANLSFTTSKTIKISGFPSRFLIPPILDINLSFSLDRFKSSFLESFILSFLSSNNDSISFNLLIELDIVFQFVKVPPNHLLFTKY